MKYRSTRGFSLVELLVVIGIIAVLLGLLFPILGRARESARTAACLSNMRQIGVAALSYSMDNEGWVLPCGWNTATLPPTANGNSLVNWWPNILVDHQYLTAPNSNGRLPQTNSVFYCPSGNMDLASTDLTSLSSFPSSRTDQHGAMAYRTWSITGTTVDCWYGMNASEQTSEASGHPCRRIAYNNSVGMITMASIKQPTNMVRLFDGFIYHLEINPNRLNARHGGATQTNLLFFDGHAATYNTALLPGGMNPPSNAFSLSYLQAGYPPPNPLWLLEQR